MEEKKKFFVKWKKDEFEIEIETNETFGNLKDELKKRTNVLPERQKWMGIKTPKDTDLISSLGIKPLQKLMMMGNPEESLTLEVKEDPNVINDLDIADDINIETKDNQVYLDKIQARISSYKPLQLNAPRPGKKLLVLDVDYTFFDHLSTASNPLILRRPYINFLLETVYPFYDIIIWSATSMKWIELKMKELQIITNTQFKVTAYFDYGAMITVQAEQYGVFNTKPLPVIWGIYKDFYNNKNTIMFDDLRRNFIMNPRNGLKIKPFRDAPVKGNLDDELLHLTKYLMLIKEVEDFAILRHSKWKRYVEKMGEKLLKEAEK